MFLFKKIVGPLFFPVPLCLLLLSAGLLLLWFTRRQKGGRILVTLGTALLTLLSYGSVSRRLLRPLERQYAPVAEVSEAEGSFKWIVVLGGGSSTDEALPPAQRLSEASLARLVEGLRLHRQLPQSRLILSGGAVYGYGADAEAMRQLALALGVDPQSVVLDAASLDTESQARNLRSVIGGDRFLLVTSASHMRRAVALFTKAGMRPVPAPAHYLAQKNRGLTPGDFFPGSGGLREAETFVYESLGSLWARLRGLS